jgi:LDH2 family malate/lactate/ureidoglycolate dehydrogenase
MLIPYQELEHFAEQILQASGVESSKAKLVAHSLVASNLRAVDSHGVQLLPFYVDQIEHGNMNIAVEGRLLVDAGGCLLYEGEKGIGQVIADRCCDHAITAAMDHGIAIVVARDSNHFGAAAYWAQKISASGLLGMVMCNASPLVAPWQGREPRLGTNPICVSVPGPRSWLLDMATTTVAAGKIFKAHINKQPTIPAGWAMDAEGAPTTDTEAAFHGLLMPLGGYKGSGLAMMVEIFCAVLGGGAMGTQLGGIRIHGKPMRASQCFIAIDVSRFMPEDEFHGRMADLVRMMKTSSPALGYDEVLVAGEPEWRAEEERRAHGVPVASGTWENLTAIAERHGIAVPAVQALS